MELQRVVPPQHISVAGNIGVGKSTLVEILAQEFGWQPYYEHVSDHPYLADYYADRSRWGFHSQIWFLTQRYTQQHQISVSNQSVIEDRSMYEDFEIFVKELHAEQVLSSRDFGLYQQLYDTLVQRIQPPTLVIYLHAQVPTLLQRIAQRGRTSELQIPVEYLTRLNQRYVQWMRDFTHCAVLTIETDDLDVVNRSHDRAAVVELIRRQLALA
jgi:deoxyadenosine/deoxycytidine kinase